MSEAHEQAAIRVKELCRERGINPAEFGRMVGVSRQQVYRWFSLSQRMPDLKIDKCAEVLGVHPAELRYAVKGAEIDKEKLSQILTDLFKQVKDRDASITPAQMAKITAAIYTHGNGKEIADYLDVISA
tara:strand:- start:9884 stop:10270 length:387 start_codon:yes stop_codon:yes gene_type:complete